MHAEYVNQWSTNSGSPLSKSWTAAASHWSAVVPTSDGGLLQVSRSNRPVQFPIALDVITEQAVSFNDVIYHGSKVSQLLYLHLGNGSLYFGAGNPAFVSNHTLNT